MAWCLTNRIVACIPAHFKHFQGLFLDYVSLKMVKEKSNSKNSIPTKTHFPKSSDLETEEGKKAFEEIQRLFTYVLPFQCNRLLYSRKGSQRQT